MAEAIFGEGVEVIDATYTGDNRSSGIYSDGDNISDTVTPGDTGVILSTGRTSAFTNNSSTNTNQSGSTTTGSRGPNNDADFNALAGTSTFDASFLEIDFRPDGDVMSLQFVFSSEEYPEFVGSIYNDVVGVWLDGQPVDLAVGTGNTNVGNVNPTNNENLFVDNSNDQHNTEMDGFTVTLTLKMDVVPGDVHTLKIGIADVGDNRYDSNLLIAGDSAQTAMIAEDDTITIAPDGTRTFNVLDNDNGPTGSTLFITHVNGAEVSAGDTIILSTGQEIQVNGDGTFTILADADEETVNFSYTIGDGTGLSDSAFVTIEQVPCFAAGTGIKTDRGRIPVEQLLPGDMVMTADDGFQPVRWVGRRQVQAIGKMAPIEIAENTFGRHDTLRVSPLHRILVRDSLTELLFGEREVLVAARDLVNGRSVRVLEGGTVEYVHILFDRHQIVYSEGLATESFLPGPQTSSSFEAEIIEEICAIFPELNPLTGEGYSQSARRTLKKYEAEVLNKGVFAA
ncbi:2,3,4,5-tetrahydropyridine-2,6-carboxylate N-succinyltransferase [Actibacterium mucosum KCTC 23349]|uniref:2,3,4,5-tetrahydropyridine-2,6-carboxylate N-succinyltransferase n=2 Tax=Actibacterium TaxID=1433986 RepID=A0A037ZPH3_9RHOB|nr:2,3,4,5-tetrahydropyridine-2,6-carboxylate N-succinyltransferase [Actibacterium mucosum KCTC 23349]